jgi:hypothetical protein
MAHRRQFVRQPVDQIVGADHRQQRLAMRREIGPAEVESEFGCDFAELRQCRGFHRIERHDPFSCSVAAASSCPGKIEKGLRCDRHHTDRS